MIAGLTAIRLHQIIGVVREEHPHLVAVVDFVVLLNQIVDVALGTVVGKVSTVAHTWWAARMFVVARVMTSVCGTHSQLG